LPTASPSLPAVFSQAQLGPSGPLHYSIRVGVHNGRTFVGPSYELVNVTCMDVPGWKVLQVPAPDAVFDYVMGDVLTSIVIELMATPSQAVLAGAEPKQLLVGWTALVPFSFIADDGSYAEVSCPAARHPLLLAPLLLAPLLLGPLCRLPTASPSLPAVFSQAQLGPSGPLHYSIRVGVHNGRTFVGPSYELVNVTCMDVPGWKVLQVPAPDAVFDYVMGDVLTSIMIELMATPS
ncbi:uncharacterized protein HaLaN_21616, partial [Haematococcus lacustris]